MTTVAVAMAVLTRAETPLFGDQGETGLTAEALRCCARHGLARLPRPVPLSIAQHLLGGCVNGGVEQQALALGLQHLPELLLHGGFASLRVRSA
eukprot:6902910-Alexandrium_andersonii.AAC.1